MARIEKPSVFRTEPKPGDRDSGEPWHAFKTSLAITFSSKLHRAFDPETLSAEVKSQIIRAIEARRSLAAVHMEFHTAVGDLVEAASAFPQFRLDAPVWMQPAAEVRKAAMRIVLESEALAARRKELAALLERVEDTAGDLGLLVSGFVEVREERSGKISMTFSLGRRITMGPLEVEREARRLRHFLRNATGVMIGASEALIRTRD